LPHCGLVPSQTSSVHGLPSLEQGVVAGTFTSAGHEVPLQTSATSHSPAAGRQVGAGLVAVAKLQAPPRQAFAVQALPSSQPVQASPLRPHCAADCEPSPTQVAPLRQPVQQVRVVPPISWLQTPLSVPTLHEVPWATLVYVHEPPLQLSIVHGLPSSQPPQSLPETPHADADCLSTGTQNPPSKQPEQHAETV
jgi:hypothetical protein